MPLILEPSGQITRGALQLWFGLSGFYSTQFGGAQLWMSSDGGSSYQPQGIILGNAAQGVLTAILASHVDPDNSNTLAVDLTPSFGSLASIATGLADLYYNLAYVDGELIAFATVTPTATSKYNITYLRRGLYGSTIGAHAIGSNFCFLGSAINPAAGVGIMTFRRELIGQALKFKFTPFNLFGAQQVDISDPSVTAFSFTPAGLGEQGVSQIPPLYYPGTFAANAVLQQYAVPPYGNFIIPTNAAGSVAVLGVACTANTSIVMKKNGSTFGTMLFLAGQSVGSFSVTKTTFIPGDVYSEVAPAIPDATAANLSTAIQVQ
jgi:hypothetical protein